MTASSNAPVIAAIITSTVSFIGVLGGFIANGVLQRRAGERRLETERKQEKYRINHDTHVLRTALLAEVRAIVTMYKGEQRFVRSESFTWVPTVDFSVYKENINKLGYLNVEEVDCITTCYYTLQERLGYIARNGIDDDRKSDAIIGRNIPYDLTSTDKRNWILNDLREILKAANRAKNAIEEHLPKRS
jgi:hypothetical protein